MYPNQWQDVVRLPWCPIKHIQLQVTQKFLNDPNLNPPKKDLAPNYLNSGVNCYKQFSGYMKTQMSSTVRHVFRFDEGRKEYE